MVSGLPFDDIRELLARLPAADAAALGRFRAARARAYAPAGSLGLLDDLAEWLVAWSGRARPAVSRPQVALFAGAHGLPRPEPDRAASRLVARCGAGEGTVNHMAAAADLGLKVFELALEAPTGDITREPALDEKACAATIAFGMEAIAGGTDLVAIAATGNDAATSLEALLAAPERGRARSQAARAALDLHAGALPDPLEALRRLGGRETAAALGAILAARMERIPVIVEGGGVVAACAVLHRLAPETIAHVRLAVPPATPLAAEIAGEIGLEPILQARLGPEEGEGCALAVSTVRLAAAAVAGIVAG